MFNLCTPEATAEAQRAQSDAEALCHLCVTLRSLRLCGCFSFFSTGGRPKAGDAYARDVNYAILDGGSNDSLIAMAAIAPSAADVIASCEPGTRSPMA